MAGRELLQCRMCRRQTSVTAGTALHRTHVPLRLWLAAAYLVTTHTPGFSVLLPRVHRTFSNLRTWLKGTRHGVSAKHLPHYVDEFVFRFNRRRTPMAAFRSLLGPSSRHPPTTHKMLGAAEPTG
jgi:hypothetical protein